MSSEIVILATVLVIGMLGGIASTRDALISEISDAAGALQDINQSYNFSGISGHSSSTPGTGFQDSLDFCDSANDTDGAADNCIVFDGEPIDEGEGLDSSSFILSDIGTFSFSVVDTGVGGSVSGTIGDGTIDTGFTVTTDTGNISGTTGANQVRFRENDANSGTFTVTYDEPLTEFEFWVRDLANIDGSPENLLGNFTLTLSDGTVINNAAFNIVPDAIAPNQDYGLFETRANDNSLLSTVNRGGNDYVTDPAFNGTGDQAAGRLVFPDVPAGGNVGVQSISFERSGGPNGFQATFSTSGRVITPGP